MSFTFPLNLQYLKSIRVRVFVITIILVSIPLLLAAYFFLNEGEEALFRERKAKLKGITLLLEKEFERKAPFIYSEVISSELPISESKEIFEEALIEQVTFIQNSYPEVGLGYFFFDLGGDVATLRPTLAPTERVYSVDSPLYYAGRQVGHSFSEESLTLILKDLAAFRRVIFLILILSLVAAITGAYFLSGNIGHGVKVIKDGLQGMERDLKARISPLEGELGEVEEAINRLASSLEEAVSRLNMVFESSPVGLLLLSFDEGREPPFKVLIHNNSFQKLIGFSKGSSTGDELLEKLTGTTLFSPKVHTAIKRGEKTEILDINFKGKIFNLFVVGLEGGALLLLEEVTERVRLQEELKRKERIASLGLLIASLTHEIKNPLTAVKGYTELLLKSPLGEKEKKYLEYILNETGRLNQLIGELLYLGRPIPPKKEKVFLKSLIEEALTGYIPLLKAQRIEVTVSIKNGMIEVDREKMLRVLTNLIKNALEAMPQGGSLTLQGEVDKNSTWLEVKDTGEGLPPEVINHIFDPFFSRKEKGVGLGLSIAHSIVSAHDGELTVSSTPGKGTSFVIKLGDRKKYSS